MGTYCTKNVDIIADANIKICGGHLKASDHDIKHFCTRYRPITLSTKGGKFTMFLFVRHLNNIIHYFSSLLIVCVHMIEYFNTVS